MTSGLKRFALVIGLLAAALPAFAAATKTAAPATTPDATTNPVFADIIKAGAKLYYFGRANGLDGWLIVKDGRVQMAYAAPDNKSIVIGAMFGPGGENITGQQVKTLFQNNKEVTIALGGAMKEEADIARAGSPATVAPAQTASTPAGTFPSVEISPGERLYQDLSAASGVTVGSGGPLLLMVMDPNCPHCQATWKAVRDGVFKGALQIRMIPIAAPGSDNERAAAVLLHVADPLNAWDKYVAGDKAQLVGTPDPVLIKALHDNHVLTDSWSIFETPYLAYRGKDGKVKVVKGEPKELAAMLTDLAP